ncbi:MAG: CAP domain-containing protein [Alphaproteobacteria bacterium]
MIRISAAVIAAALLVGLPAAVRAGDDAARMVTRVNAARAEHGLAPIAIDLRLTRAAQSHAEAMAAGGALFHDGADGTLTERMARVGYAFAVVAEDVGGGTAGPEETVAVWLQSPRHARNLLLPEVRHAGIGHARAAPGKTAYSDYWSIVLAKPAEP